MKHLPMRGAAASLLLFLSLTATADLVSAPAQRPVFTPREGARAFVVREVDGRTTCRDASPEEAARITRRPAVPLRVFGESNGPVRTNATLSANLNIILRGTAQLDANPQAKQAFERAAAIWESRIANPVTVYVDVDFGSTRFGEPFEEGVIASADTNDLGGEGLYGDVRGLLLARADNAAETAIYNALPGGATLPTDNGATGNVLAPSMLLQAIAAIDATADPGDDAPSIGFNSAFPYDFDPSNGISPGTKDFEGVVVHEVGHMLGFVSSVGNLELGATANFPAIFDFFRFRPGVSTATFGSAQRVQSSGGTQVFFAGGSTLAFSTGRGDGEGGDERQASHWKDDDLAGVRIGIMDPTLDSGVRTELTNDDLVAFGMMGWNIIGGGGTVLTPAAPSNLTATATGATVIRLQWVDNSNNETQFRVEQRNSSGTFVDIGSAEANATGINVTGFAAGQTGTFRIRARNGSGDSGYSNEASATTPGGNTGGPCVPSSTVVCLLSNRFRVSIAYINQFANPPAAGTFLGEKLVAGVQNPDVATFGISGAKAIEAVVRIQDARPFGVNRFDIYYGGLTDLEYTVTVTDTQTGNTRTYRNAPGTVGGGLDRSSFPGAVTGEDHITSGGFDSFPAGERLERPATAHAPLTKAEARLLHEAVLEARSLSMAPELAALSLVQMSSGGGGACAESEPNERIETASTIQFSTPCTGNASIADISSYSLDGDGIEDVWKVTLPSAGNLDITLTFTNSSADLDLYLFNGSLAVLGEAIGVTTTERIQINSLAAGTYYIGVSAFLVGGSPYTLTVTSSAAAATPAAPTNLTATATSATTISLGWTDNATNETSYILEGRVGSGSFVEVATGGANSNQASLTGATPGTTYTFRVKARNAAGDSGYSNQVSVTTPSGNTGGPCVVNGTTACLANNRFRVSIAYVNAFVNPPQPGNFLGAKLIAGVQNPDVATFGISSALAIEVVVRIQDVNPFGVNRFDIYAGGLTDLEYTVTVTDTQTGRSKTYRNPPGTVGGVVDRLTFTY